jgi:hypothetical protein
MTMFKSGIDLFTVLMTEAEDGGKKAISAKNQQREVMIREVTLLGHYVESACNDDLATFNTSGFVAASTSRNPPQPLPPATIAWMDRGPGSGEVVVKPTGLPKALSYNLQYGLVASPGTPPATWTTLTGDGFKEDNHFEPDAGRELCVPDPCVGPAGLQRLE